MSTVEPIRKIEDILKIEYYLQSKNKRDFLIFVFGINTGLRISDILNLNVSDVVNKTHIEIQEQKTKKKKIFALNQKITNMLKEYIFNSQDINKPLFIGQKGARLNRSQVYRFLNDACKKCNININVGTHTMRKTFGYHYYKKYNDIVMLQKILNHSTPNITLSYIGISQDEIDYSYKNFVL